MTEIAQHQSQSQQIFEVQSNQLQLQPMQSPLQKATNESLQQIQNEVLTLNDMFLENLKKYLTGLRLYKSQLIPHIQDVSEQIHRKEPIKKRAPKTAEKATNWWAAMGIIFLCLSAIITVAYSLCQIQQIQTEWIKLVLIIAVLGVVFLMLFVTICKWIRPHRDINLFQQLFENQEY